MRILHYSLGMAPFRSGGLTKYATDLMSEQLMLKHEVSLLYPGTIKLIGKKTVIKEERLENGINIYELINPLPVSLVFGIADTEPYYGDTDRSVYIEFFKKHAFDCIHLHTIMGLHPSFIEAANQLKIKVIYTTHDYFGIWPDITLFDSYTILQENNFLLGDITNMPELSTHKITFVQSKFYRKTKNTTLIKKIRKSFKANKSEDTDVPLLSSDLPETHYQELRKRKEKYEKLRHHYVANFFDKIDVFLFNSSVSKMVFEHYVKVENFVVLPVTHGSISKTKQRGRTKIVSDELRLLFVGDTNYFKGLPYLIEVIDSMEEPIKEKLSVTTIGNKVNRPYCRVIPPYNSSDVTEVLQEYDAVIYPSMWFETFGFGVIEAYHAGRLSIVSKFVGGSDVINKANAGFVFNDEEQLKDILVSLTKNDNCYVAKIKDMNETNYSFYTLNEHTKNVLEYYK